MSDFQMLKDFDQLNDEEKSLALVKALICNTPPKCHLTMATLDVLFRNLLPVASANCIYKGVSSSLDLRERITANGTAMVSAALKHAEDEGHLTMLENGITRRIH